MKVITLANMKGGVGKSSSATALSAILTERGYRTLLIDCDQQCNSTDTYRAETEGAATVYDVLLDDSRISVSEAVQHNLIRHSTTLLDKIAYYVLRNS